MTFLEAVQKLAGLALVSAPGSVDSTLERHRDLVRFYQLAHEEIQGQFFDWSFLWASGSQDTVAGTAVYTQDGLGIWDRESIHLDGVLLDVRFYDEWDHRPVTQGRPSEAYIRPDNGLLLHPTPNAVYPLTYDYYLRPKVLSGDSDTHLIPDQFQMAIVGRALMMYANQEAAEELRVQGQELYEQYYTKLKLHQTPRRQQIQGRSQAASDFVVIAE